MRISILYFLAVSFLLFGCVSSKKELNRGNYAAAVHKSVRKLRKNRTNTKEVFVLEQAYSKANQQDFDRIEFLKKEGNPDIWDEVFSTYSTLKNRQDYVKTVLPLKVSGREANIPVRNYDEELIAAKKKAAEYFYAHGNQLLSKNDKFEARKAYSDFQMVKNYYSNYKDVDDLLLKSRSMGVSRAMLKMDNKSGIPLPKEFEEDLFKISLNDLNSTWMIYDTKYNKDANYDYGLIANIKTIAVSPESVKEIRSNETMEVPDGFSYVLDKKGNVMKDSLGNDIKIPKTKTISCTVIQVLLHKQAVISGTLDYVDIRTGQLLRSDPITSEVCFDNISATAIGDLNALKPETKQLLNNRPMPFPSDPAMLMQSSHTLKEMIKGIVYNNRYLLK